MANATSANLKLTVQQTGENPGTWGQITNTNLLILEQAIGGYAAVNSASGATLTFSDGALSNGKNKVLKLTGNITGNVNVIVPNDSTSGTPPTKTYIVHNGTTGAHTVTFKTQSGTGITWSATDKGKKILYSDGTNIEEGITSTGSLITENITTSNLTVTNSTNVSGITISDNVTAANNITTTAGDMVDQIGEIRSVPINSKTSAYTLIAADHGKFISTNSAVTVPPSVFSAGQTVTIYNNSGSSFAITKGSGVTMYWVQTGANADRTLATRGVATILCVGTNTFVITGGLLT
tara:strand:+ start:145 stop:1023 length:879 start_codon:yes stop_codon:yes gene_type:complete